jgi:hypothetical protein
MKTLFYLLYFIIVFQALATPPPIEISTKWLGDQETTRKNIMLVVKDFANELELIRKGLREAQKTSLSEQKKVIETSLQGLEAILDRQDISSTSGLQNLIDLLHKNNSDESSQIIPGFGNSRIQTGLNYFIDRIFRAKMMGLADVVGEQEMEAMIRFYAGNPAQTSEGSWETNNTMLFVFGDRLLNTLVKKVPDRIDAFYKAVVDARKSAQSGPGPDEEAIPDSERPTAEQLRAYEATFVRLEALVATGVLPESDLTSQADPTRASSLPDAVPWVRPPPKQSAETKPSTTQSEDSTSSTPWSVIGISMAATIGLAWLLLKKRK